jgi:nicotinate-nucleotide adenylyltransferase
MIRRIGIFSGTFDPVHHGHIAFCLEVLRECQLDEIVLIPEGRPRNKQHVSSLPDRLVLLEQTVGPQPHLRATTLESDQFTVGQTLPELKRRFENAELILLVGSDVARTFLYRWQGLKELLVQVSLAIGLRQGDTAAEMKAIISQLQQEYGIPVRHTLIQSPHADISSSQIRARINKRTT